MPNKNVISSQAEPIKEAKPNQRSQIKEATQKIQANFAKLISLSFLWSLAILTMGRAQQKVNLSEKAKLSQKTKPSQKTNQNQEKKPSQAREAQTIQANGVKLSSLCFPWPLTMVRKAKPYQIAQPSQKAKSSQGEQRKEATLEELSRGSKPTLSSCPLCTFHYHWLWWESLKPDQKSSPVKLDQKQ